MAFTTLALLLAAGGAAVNAIGKVKAGHADVAAGQAQQAAAESQAGLDDYNAGVAKAQAADAITRGALDENRFRAGIRQQIGNMRAGYAASNIDVSKGSSVDVQADAAKLGELDALTIRTNAARTAWGYDVQAYDLTKAGEIARKTGVYDAAAGEARQQTENIGAAGTLLTTGASLLSSKYGFGTVG